MKIKAKDLRLADVVDDSPFIGGFHTAIVSKIKEETVRLFRPYGVTADFSYSGGVICYVGIEEYEIPRDNSEIEVFLRKDLK